MQLYYFPQENINFNYPATLLLKKPKKQKKMFDIPGVHTVHDGKSHPETHS